MRIMSFSGKKYRRTRHVNIEEMLRQPNENAEMLRCLMNAAPVFSFIRLDERTFIFKLILKEKVMSHKFRLGEEFEMERLNGSKVKVTYTLESDNILHQVIKLPDGRVAEFRREFGEVTKMTIYITGMRQYAVVYYECVD